MSVCWLVGWFEKGGKLHFHAPIGALVLLLNCLFSLNHATINASIHQNENAPYLNNGHLKGYLIKYIEFFFIDALHL